MDDNDTNHIELSVEERLESAEQERDAARSELATANARITDLEAEVATITQDRDSANARVTELEAEVATITQDRDSANARVTELEAEARSAEIRAHQILSESGHPPVDTGGDGGGSVKGGSLSEQYAAITDPGDKTAFYRKHKAALVAEIRKSPAA